MTAPGTHFGRENMAHRCNATLEIAAICLYKLNVSRVWLDSSSLNHCRLSELIKNIKELNMPDISSITPCSDRYCGQSCASVLESMGRDIRLVKEHVLKMAAGACLDCFKGKGVACEECRHKHEV